MSVILDVAVLRELLRNLVAFRSLYESTGQDEISHGDFQITLWDLEYLVEQLPGLPPRQAEAIRFCLIENMREEDAAVRMGVSRTNPVAMYATEGLRKLVAMVEQGSLPRFRPESEVC